MTTKEEIVKLLEEIEQKDSKCPHCGKCKYCGQPNYVPQVIPNWPYPIIPNPNWPVYASSNTTTNDPNIKVCGVYY